MMGRTHALGGVATVWLLHLVPGAIATGMIVAAPNNLGLLASVAALGALLPDLDASASLLSTLRLDGGKKSGRGSGLEITPFALPSMLLHQAFGHRGALHSLAALGVVATVGGALGGFGYVGWQAAAVLTLGYGSHLLLDSCTPHGIPLLWPRRGKFHLLPRGLRVSTGSHTEEIVLALLALAVLTLLIDALPNSF